MFMFLLAFERPVNLERKILSFSKLFLIILPRGNTGMYTGSTYLSLSPKRGFSYTYYRL